MLYWIIKKIWRGLTSHVLYQSAIDYYCWGTVLVARASRSPSTFAYHKPQDVYTHAGRKFRAACAMNPTLPWTLDTIRGEEKRKRRAEMIEQGLVPDVHDDVIMAHTNINSGGNF